MTERLQLALQAIIVTGVLAASLYGIVASATTTPPQVVALSPGPDASLIASTLGSARPTPTLTLTPSPTPSPSPTFATLPPTPSPSPTPQPPVTQRYAYGGRAYTGVTLGTGWTVVAPFDARLETHVYQLVDGQIREGTDVAGLPKYPYLILIAPDRRLTLRPGALDSDVVVLAREGQLSQGASLFRIAGTGPSSWHYFYDDAVGAQIIASLASAAGADLDAASSIKVK